MTPAVTDALVYVALVMALVSAGTSLKCYIDMKRTERGSAILATLHADLARLHETRAEMYRAFIIERQTTGRPFTNKDEHKINGVERQETFGGAK